MSSVVSVTCRYVDMGGNPHTYTAEVFRACTRDNQVQKPRRTTYNTHVARPAVHRLALQHCPQQRSRKQRAWVRNAQTAVTDGLPFWVQLQACPSGNLCACHAGQATTMTV